MPSWCISISVYTIAFLKESIEVKRIIFKEVCATDWLFIILNFVTRGSSRLPNLVSKGRVSCMLVSRWLQQRHYCSHITPSRGYLHKLIYKVISLTFFFLMIYRRLQNRGAVNMWTKSRWRCQICNKKHSISFNFPILFLVEDHHFTKSHQTQLYNMQSSLSSW